MMSATSIAYLSNSPTIRSKQQLYSTNYSGVRGNRRAIMHYVCPFRWPAAVAASCCATAAAAAAAASRGCDKIHFCTQVVVPKCIESARAAYRLSGAKTRQAQSCSSRFWFPARVDQTQSLFLSSSQPASRTSSQRARQQACRLASALQWSYKEAK